MSAAICRDPGAEIVPASRAAASWPGGCGRSSSLCSSWPSGRSCSRPARGCGA